MAKQFLQDCQRQGPQRILDVQTEDVGQEEEHAQTEDVGQDEGHEEHAQTEDVEGQTKVDEGQEDDQTKKDHRQVEDVEKTCVSWTR